MSPRIFVNNVDGYLAGAICADLRKVSTDIVGTRKCREDGLVPPVVKKIVPRIAVRALLKEVAASDIVVYDLHDADLEELELVLHALHASDIAQEMTFVLVSSVGTWAHTAREFKEVLPSARASPAPPAACPSPAPAPAALEKPSEKRGSLRSNPRGSVDKSSPSNPQEPAAGALAASKEEEGGEAKKVAQPVIKPVPLASADYIRRVPAPKFQDWRTIETLVLGLQEKSSVKAYVACAGIPYGNGEDAFLGLFSAAWQNLPTLRVIGDGSNFIPLVHVRDAARLVRHIVEGRPAQDYHLAVDHGELTQREIVEAVASTFGVPYEIQSVSVAEALLAELADILTLDLRMLPSDLMLQDVNTRVEASGDPEITLEGDVGVDTIKLEVLEAPKEATKSFRWWCKQGLAANVEKVAREFCRWRRLEPVRLCIMGALGSGYRELAAPLAARYNVPLLIYEDLLEECRRSETPLGEVVNKQLEDIEKGLTNPKYQGPTTLPTVISAQVVDAALKANSVKFRGFVLCGYPQTVEDAFWFFAEDGPRVPRVAPADVAGGADDADPAPLLPRRLARIAVALDAAVVLTAPDEACMNRLQYTRSPAADAEFKKKMDRWKKAQDGLAAFFREQIAIEPMRVDTQAASASAGGDASDPDAFVHPTIRSIVALVASSREVFNFLDKGPPEGATVSEGLPLQVTEEDEAARRQRELLLQRQKAEEERLQQIKREERVKLEKHSEPLRQYLMNLVVPTLTTGLIDMCREQPEDPIGYLAEYLAVYSQVAKTYGKRPSKVTPLGS